MKTTLLTLSLLLSTTLLADELSWVDEQVKAIKPSRSGMTSSYLRGMSDPFVFLDKNRTTPKESDKKKNIASSPKQQQVSSSANITSKAPVIKTTNRVLALGAIMNNAVMISGQWYKLGDNIDGYKISEINQNSVLLRKKKKELLLSTKSSSKKLKFLK